MKQGNFFILGMALTVCIVCSIAQGEEGEIAIDLQRIGQQDLLQSECRVLSAEDELDLQNFFGDPEDRGGSDEVRIRGTEMSALKIFFLQWGVWVAVRCDEVLSYMKAFKKTVRKNFFAYMGWKYGKKGCSREA